jgi:hypothetical protein
MVAIFKCGTAKINELYLARFGDACEVFPRLRALMVHRTSKKYSIVKMEIMTSKILLEIIYWHINTTRGQPFECKNTLTIPYNQVS